MVRPMVSILLIGAFDLFASACTSPVTVEPAFKEPPRSTVRAMIAPNCRLEVMEILDVRRAPDILGVVGRAVKAPDDRAAWLRSVVAGLSTRGFSVDFGGATPAAARALIVRMTLVAAWVTETSTNKNANVVWRVMAQRPNTPVVTKNYRGAVSTVNWTDSSKELRGLVDQAFARSLDAMAPDLHGLCDSD